MLYARDIDAYFNLLLAKLVGTMQVLVSPKTCLKQKFSEKEVFIRRRSNQGGGGAGGSKCAHLTNRCSVTSNNQTGNVLPMTPNDVLNVLHDVMRCPKSRKRVN